MIPRDPWMILGGLFLAFVVISAVGGITGLGTPRGESVYTGYVVDVEDDKGLIFRTSQALVKTDQESSVAEQFCLDDESDVEAAKEFLQNGEKVDIEYSRGVWVNPFDCQSELSVTNSIEPANTTSSN